MTDRVYNFSPGPAVLPLPVLERAQRELVCLPGVGSSILEISHRSKPFLEILAAAEANLRKLLAIPDGYQVLFLQGGARLQFSMVPINLLRGSGKTADYVVTGAWGTSAHEEATREGNARIVWDGKPTNYDRLPRRGEIALDPAAAYVHFTSNETIQGVQFPGEPAHDVLAGTGAAPLVCDASSDFLSRPIDVARYGLIYACAQKNAGPAGVTVVVVRQDLLDRAPAGLASMLDYRRHAKEGSLFNTPPTFAIYIVRLVTQWLLDEMGGLERMAERNRAKAQMLYDAIDSSDGYYIGHAQRDCRSAMNVTFRFASEEIEKQFLAEAARLQLCELKGHRSVGGIRASIYNAMPVEGVQRLAQFMREFHARPRR